MLVCVQFVSSRSGVVFNPSVDAITDHSQSAKDIYSYFKSQLYAEEMGHRTPILILSNELSKPGERTHDRNVISAVGGIRTHNLLIDSPACYQWAITATENAEIYKLLLKRRRFKHFCNSRVFNKDIV